MAPETSVVQQQAMRSYEVGRLKWALRKSWFVTPLLALSLLLGEPASSFGIGILLLSLVTGLFWRGQDFSKSVFPGILSGLIPLSIPLLMRLTGHACVDQFCLFCAAFCVAAGVALGAFVAIRVNANIASRPAIFLSTLIVGGVTGALGCVPAGLGGAVGMLAGTLLSAVPGWFVWKRRNA